MQTNQAMLAGRSEYSLRSAMETANSISISYLSAQGALGNYVQYIYMTPALVNIRFGEWKRILEGPSPNPSMIYASILYRFAKGMAETNQSRFTAASDELSNMELLMKDSSLYIPFTPFSPAIEGAKVAHGILAGAIALKEKNFEKAIASFQHAVETEESMVYNEPRDWVLNPKHYLGNAYLNAGQWKNAESTFKKDLLNNNENGWALFGLYSSLIGQRRKADADKVLVRFKKAFDKADIKITSSVY
jgi:tetratricopeptide (TPR) repeat protein